MAGRGKECPQPASGIYGDGAVLHDPYLIRVRIQNTGKRGVAAADFIHPIRIDLGHKDLYHAYVSATSRPGVIATDDIFDESIEDELVLSIRPELLHAGDWFDVTMINDGDPMQIEASADWPDRDRPMRPAALQPRPRRRLGVLNWYYKTPSIWSLGRPILFLLIVVGGPIVWAYLLADWLLRRLATRLGSVNEAEAAERR